MRGGPIRVPLFVTPTVNPPNKPNICTVLYCLSLCPVVSCMPPPHWWPTLHAAYSPNQAWRPTISSNRPPPPPPQSAHLIFTPIPPQCWFNCLDSTFATANITQSITKFHWAMSKLPLSLIATVRPLSRDPTAVADLYKELKELLLRSYGLSDEQRTSKWLDYLILKHKTLKYSINKFRLSI